MDCFQNVISSALKNTFLSVKTQKHRKCHAGSDSSLPKPDLMMENNHKYKKLYFCNQNAKHYTTFSVTDELFSPTHTLIKAGDQLLPKCLVSFRDCVLLIH